MSSDSSFSTSTPARAKRKKAKSNVKAASRYEAATQRNAQIKSSAVSAAQQVSRMESIGQLAGGIAHDFNNLLTVILGHSEFLLKRNESEEASLSRIDEIRKAAERAAGLTNQLLAYSRNQLLEPTVFQIHSVLEELDGILRRVLGEDIALDVLVDPDIGWVKVDCGQLQQIILNLTGNARDAMPQGGRLRIEISNVCVPGKAAASQPFVAPGEYVSLVVRDSGVGIDAETRARIFEPFFTTKEKGKGTGLGLATVYGIVKQSGGYIWVGSEVGTGSSFHTLFPRVPEPSGPRRVLPEILDFRSGGETILLVEDNQAVRKMAAEVLHSAGYQVLVAPNGPDALRLASQHHGVIDLLLTDVVMPGMTGPELADRFAAEFPRIQLLYISGYTDDALANHGLRGHTRGVLQKPFTHEKLARRVYESLEPVRRR